ncbi:MAG: MerC domain-containing protein [Myxococcales bacterium]|nr:MerC domain-containing protein [Myxococcales bacterium]MCA9615794.1 MerC domain-containing protein [Myxococcales bacterium]
MPKVELVYDADCPNVAKAREALMRGFGAAGVTARWAEHLSVKAPAYARGLGSPTILVDERDVSAGGEPSPEACCRLYETGDGRLAGVPDVEVIARAIERAADRESDNDSGGSPPGWRSSLGAIPAIGAALLPKVACPACWPAYAGVLSSFGLTFLMETRWLLPLTASFLVLALGTLAFRAPRRRGYGPFGLGLLGATVVMAGKFALENDPAMYIGIALLVGASLWNAWPRRAQDAACAACEPAP